MSLRCASPSPPAHGLFLAMSLNRRRAPAVVYPLRRSRVLGVLLAVILMVSVAACSAWALRGAPSWWLVAAAGGSWLLAAGGVIHFWMLQWRGAIRWDGQCWSLERAAPHAPSTAILGAPEVLLDLQSHLWVHARPTGGGAVWLWLECSAQPERWMDLRRAVYSRASPGADNADETAPAISRRRES